MRRHLVEEVDEDGRTVGTRDVNEAHEAPGVWHRAFSVVAVAADGRTLLQRRASVKVRFAGVWANTCCGHVHPGMPVLDQARRRVREELGLELDGLIEVGRFRYEAPDLGGTPPAALIEREFDHVVLARLAQESPAVPLFPDPAEVAETVWVPLDDESAWPEPLAHWAPLALRIARDGIPLREAGKGRHA